MSSPLGCPRCGFQNSPGYQFCVNCGAPLGGAPAFMPAGTTSGYPPPTGYAAIPPAVDYKRQEHVDRTRTGLLLLMLGALLGWVPFGISLIGVVLSLIGAILVILGRKAFGGEHTRFVLVAIVLFFVGILINFVAGIALGLAVVSAALGTAPTAASLESAVNVLLIGSILAAIVGGLAQVLFTSSIQNPPGRVLLFAGYGAQVALQAVIFLLISPLLAAMLAAAFASGTYDPVPLATLQAQISTWQVFAVIPDLLFAGAYYLAWSRVSRGEIPEGTAASPGGLSVPQPPPQAPPPSGPAPPINPN